jgi:hypothetical protein
MSVQQLQVVESSTPALGFGNDVIDFDGVVLGEVQPTRAALSPLALEESSHAGVDRRMTA